MFLYVTVSTLNPIAVHGQLPLAALSSLGMVETTSPICNRYRIVVCLLATF